MVRTGDTVTVTLHNGITTPMSLAFPGHPELVVHRGPVRLRPGDRCRAGRHQHLHVHVPTRPGTFLYEAGHTANGSRQVAMGLAGALVVLPGDGTAYGSAASGYDDEAVLVLVRDRPRPQRQPA